MSYGVCHMQKFTSGSVKGIEIHNQREKIGISHSNPDIDWSKSDLNYDLHNQEIKSYNKTIKNRVSQLDLKKAVRKDAIVMCGFIVTSDKEYFEKKTAGETIQYFQDSYEFLKERYGADNVISATVHLDETTPHLHFNFVPVTVDGRLSAKSIFTRTELNSLQTDFHKSVCEKHGLERGIEGSNAKHIEIARLKTQTANKDLIFLQEQKQVLESKLEPLQDTVNGLFEFQKIQVKDALLTKNVIISRQDYEKLYEQGVNGYKTKYNLEDKNKSLLEDNEKMEQKYNPLLSRNTELVVKNMELQEIINKKNEILKNVGDAFDRNPELKRAYQETHKIIQTEKQITHNKSHYHGPSL